MEPPTWLPGGAKLLPLALVRQAAHRAHHHLPGRVGAHQLAAQHVCTGTPALPCSRLCVQTTRPQEDQLGAWVCKHYQAREGASQPGRAAPRAVALTAVPVVNSSSASIASCTDTWASSTVYPRSRASSMIERRVTPGRMVP